MPTLMFTRCQCGIEYKILREDTQTQQRYACSCGQWLIFKGGVVTLWSSTKRAGTGIEWVQVPLSLLRELENGD
jgi:hypothetical protein